MKYVVAWISDDSFKPFINVVEADREEKALEYTFSDDPDIAGLGDVIDILEYLSANGIAVAITKVPCECGR